MSTAASTGALWGRKWSLVVGSGTTGIDLSDSTNSIDTRQISTALRMRFEVRADDEETPNTLVVRIYNPSPNTVKQVAEFDTVMLQAGYENNFGVIFSGSVKQIYEGKENNIDRYLDIYAADGDLGYNFGVINATLKAGATWGDILAQSAQAMNVPVATSANGYLATGGILARGKTLWGMARAAARNVANNNGCRWSIQNGVLTLIPNNNFLPSNQVPVISSTTGMIGTPRQTDNGVIVRCLINPSIQVGQAIQIASSDINQNLVYRGGLTNQTLNLPLSQLATISNNGLYRVIVREHVGDTRDNDWYTELTCLSIDSSMVAGGVGQPGCVQIAG